MEKGHAAPFEAEELIEYLPALRGLARALVRGDEVEDLVAATMLRAVERPPKHRGNVRAWLARTLRNLAVDGSRKQSTRRRTSETIEQQVAGREVPPTPDAMMARSEALRLLHEMLDEMGDPDRHLLFLRYFDGLGANEIGERLDILPATARTRLSAALGRLRARLRDRYGKDAFAPCFLIIEPLSRLAPVATTTAGAATLGSYLTFKKVLLGLLPALLLLGAYLGWGNSWFDSDLGRTEAHLSEEPEPHNTPAVGFANPPSNANQADRLPVEAGDPNRVILVDESGQPLADHHVQIYFRGNGFARFSDRDGSMLWPQEFQEGGLLFIWAKGRVPTWLWRDPLDLGQRIVVPSGRRLLVRAEYEDRVGAPQPHFSFDFSAWAPKPGSVGFELREHVQGADSENLIDPASLYTQDHVVKVDEQNECEFLGLPEGELELRLRSRSFDWRGARVGKIWQSVHIADGQESCLAELQLRDAWTARIVAHGPIGQQAMQSSAVEFSVQGSGRGQFWSPQIRQDGGIDLWIPHDPDFPAPQLANGWEAELWLQWLGARVRWPVTLVQGGGDLGVLQIDEPAMIPAFVEDESGAPIAGARLRLGDETFATDAQGMALLPIMVSGNRELPDQVFVYAEAEGYLAPDDVRTLIENGEIRLRLHARTGIRVVCSLRGDMSEAPITANIRIACLPSEGGESELPALYERVLSDSEQALYLPLNARPVLNRASKISSVKGSLSLKAGATTEPYELLGLAPNGPVELTIELGGAEVHREVLPSWPHNQLFERSLKFDRPKTFRVHGIVHDDLGNVVPGARIYARMANGTTTWTDSDVFGEFALEGLTSLNFKIWAQPTEPNWLRVPLQEMALPDEQHLIELVAERGKTIAVSFVDAAGKPADIAHAAADVPGREGSYIFGTKTRRDQVRFLVPREGQVNVIVQHLGVRIRQRFELDAEDFVFPLPSGIAVQVDWSAIELPEQAWLYLLAKPIDGNIETVMLELTPRAGSQANDSPGTELTRKKVEMLAGQYQMYLSVRDVNGGVWRQLPDAAPMESVTIAPGTLQTLRFLPVE